MISYTTNTQWGDLLTSYNGTTITYDEIGNPLSYYNGTAYTFTWEGRRLVGAVKGTKTMSFTYNSDGIRTSKTVNGVKHTYYLNGSLIMAEQWEDKLLVYLYDASGLPIGMMYRTDSYASDSWDTFWFEKNLQGNIVAVYNESGTKVATYNYSDAWGNHTTTYTNGGGSTGAQYNPFRYRGYYYDIDLGMYYLQSRYYDATICRFINADGYVSTGQGILGNNMFAYCNNNPVMGYDPTGEYCVANKDGTDTNYLDDWLIEGAGVSGGSIGGGFGGGNYVVNNVGSSCGSAGIGFKTFNGLKGYLGSAGENCHWHHIVEKCQIDKSGFSPEQIHNTSNVVPVDKAIHGKISGYYSSRPNFAGGLTFRNWLAGQPFEVQSRYGWEIYCICMEG